MADSTMSVTDTAAQADETVESLPPAPQADARKASRAEKRREWQKRKIEGSRRCGSCKRDKQGCERYAQSAPITKCKRCSMYNYSCSFEDQTEDESRSRRTLDLVKCDSCRTSKQKCTPPDRNWPEEKCDRCMTKGLPCSKGTRSGETTEPSVGALRSTSSPSTSVHTFTDGSWPRSPFFDVPTYQRPVPPKPMQTLAPYQFRALKTLLQSGLEKEDITSVSKLGIEGIERLLKIWEREGREGMNSLLNPIKGVDSSLLEASLLDMSQHTTTITASIRPIDIPPLRNLYNLHVPSAFIAPYSKPSSVVPFPIEPSSWEKKMLPWQGHAVPQKDTFQYVCTFCCAIFRHSFEWRRHETAVHCPHLGWTCMATGPVTEDDECVFCSTPHPSEAHLEQHRASDCLVKRTLEDRKYNRKDLLLQHVRAIHLARDASKSFNIPEAWRTDTEPLSIHPVWCGFCQETFRTTAHRMDHVAQHFQQGCDMTAWVPPSASVEADFQMHNLPSEMMDTSDPTPSRIDETHDHASLPTEPRDSATPVPSSEADNRMRQEVALHLSGTGEQFAAQPTQPKRSHITPEAREILAMSFERNRYPDVTRINELAQRTGLSAKAVRNWMSNRRARPPLEDEAQPKCGG